MMRLLVILLVFAISVPAFSQEAPAASPETLQLVAPVAAPAVAAPAVAAPAVVETEEFIDPEASPDDGTEPAAPDAGAPLALEPTVPQPVELQPTPAPVATPEAAPTPAPVTEKAPDAAAPAEPEAAIPEDVFLYDVAVLQGLNKVTARISEIEAPVGTSVRFGNLDIVVNRCWKSSPTEQPENAARVSIIERRPDEAPIEVFNGWMFSSSPSLSGLEHPVYDLIVLTCGKRKMDPNT